MKLNKLKFALFTLLLCGIGGRAFSQGAGNPIPLYQIPLSLNFFESGSDGSNQFNGYGKIYTSEMGIVNMSAAGDTIFGGYLLFSLALPAACQIVEDSLNFPPGWTYVMNQPNAILVTNTSANIPGVFEDPIAANVRLKVPFLITGPFTNQPMTAQVSFLTWPESTNPTRINYDDNNGVDDNFTTVQVSALDVNLPIIFANFDGKMDNCQTFLNWEMGGDGGQTDYFEIERSKNGKNFEAIGKTGFDASNKYKFVDESPLYGNSFYRIKEVEIGGRTIYSRVLNLINNCKPENVSLYPNPTKGIVYVDGLANADKLEVYNVLGQRVLSQDVTEEKALIDLTRFADGNYTIRVVSGGVSIFEGKVTKR